MHRTLSFKRTSACTDFKKWGISDTNRAALIRKIRKGIGYNTVTTLQSCLDVSESKFAGITHIALRTLARRKKEGRLGIDESERIVRLSLLFAQAVRVFGSIEEARKWFKTSNRALGGTTPFEYADTEPGAREIEDILGRIEHGVFA